MDLHSIVSHHDVQGSSVIRGTSSGRDGHASQVAPDRDPATMNNQRKVCMAAMWNVRTMQPSGKLHNILEEMEHKHPCHQQINILGL